MEKKKKFQIPTTCALLFMLMIVCAVHDLDRPCRRL